MAEFRPTDPTRKILWEMVDVGELQWRGGKPSLPVDPPVNTGRLISDIVLEDRGPQWPVAEWAAGRLALSHELRGMDAMQLAAAVTLRERLRAGASDSATAEIVFAAFDRRLLEAAEREGFQTLGGDLG